MTNAYYLVPGIDDIINRVKASRGWSFTDLAARTDGELSRQRWHQLAQASRIKEFPEPSSINAIANALEVDVSTVVLALAKTIGLDVRPASSAADILPPEADMLAPNQKEAIRILIKSMVPNV